MVFREGQLLSGVLDKSQFGASQFGLVHSCQELYGGGVASQLLSALGRLFTTFLQLHGFSLGVEDILVRPEVSGGGRGRGGGREKGRGEHASSMDILQADDQRREHIEGLRGCGSSAAAEAFSLQQPSPGEGDATSQCSTSPCTLSSSPSLLSPSVSR